MQCKKYLYDHYHVKNESSRCIPLASVWALLDGPNIAVDCLRQLVCVLNFFCRLDDSFVYDLDIRDMYIIHEGDHRPYHVYFIDPRIQCGYTITEKYGVRIDWDNIKFRKNCRSEAFHFTQSRFRQSLFLQLFCNEFRAVLDADHPLHALSRALDKSSISPWNTLLIQDEEWTPLLWQIIQLPLPDPTPSGDMEDQLHYLLKRIMAQYEQITTQFKDQNNGKIILTEWHMILRAHTKEFWEVVQGDSSGTQLEKFVKRLRNYLYQLLVDHHYQHVILKKVDFKSLIVACYLWSAEYSKWVARHTSLFRWNDNADKIFLMIMDLFVSRDTLDIGDRVLVVDSRGAPTGIIASQELVETHPTLRPQYFLERQTPDT